MSGRRTRLGPSFASCVLAALLAACGGGSPEPDPRPAPDSTAPNIVFVLLDDATKAQYSAETMPFTWRYMRRHATTFTDYLVTSPLCCPARASIITGQYGHNNGVLSNSYGDLRDPGNVLPVWLQRAGYQTAHVGKFLNNYTKTLEDPAMVTPGWDEWFTQLEPQSYYDYEISDNGEPVEFGSEDGDYLTRVLNARAQELIEGFAGREEKFFLALEHFAPHFGPGDEARCTGAATPDPLDAGRFAGAEVPPSPGLSEDDTSDKPPFIRSLPRRTPPRMEKADQRYGCALASLRAVDRGFEAMVAKLEELGLTEDTVLVLSSDNGLFYGEHGIPNEKQFPYREAYEVPLQIALPEPLDPAAPGPVEAPVASIDLAPTFLELAGGEPCAAPDACRALDGRSLMPLLTRGSAERWGGARPRGIELSLPQNNEPYDRVCEYFGVRAGRWAYVKHVSAARVGEECLPSGAVELYDLEADPFQLENLAGELPGVEARLARLAEETRRCAGSGAADEPVRPCG